LLKTSLKEQCSFTSCLWAKGQQKCRSLCDASSECLQDQQYVFGVRTWESIVDEEQPSHSTLLFQRWCNDDSSQFSRDL